MRSRTRRRTAHGDPGQARSASRNRLLTCAPIRGAGDGNRTRTISLGICAIRAAIQPDLREGLPLSDRERPFVTGVNGTLMARRSCPAPGQMALRPSLSSVADLLFGWSGPSVAGCCRMSQAGLAGAVAVRVAVTSGKDRNQNSWHEFPARGPRAEGIHPARDRMTRRPHNHFVSEDLLPPSRGLSAGVSNLGPSISGQPQGSVVQIHSPAEVSAKSPHGASVYGRI